LNAAAMLIQVPRGSNVEPTLAWALLLLVQESHHDFDKSQRNPD
jgi:hypothetical protein